MYGFLLSHLPLHDRFGPLYRWGDKPSDSDDSTLRAVTGYFSESPRSPGFMFPTRGRIESVGSREAQIGEPEVAAQGASAPVFLRILVWQATASLSPTSHNYILDLSCPVWPFLVRPFVPPCRHPTSPSSIAAHDLQTSSYRPAG